MKTKNGLIKLCFALLVIGVIVSLKCYFALQKNDLQYIDEIDEQNFGTFKKQFKDMHKKICHVLNDNSSIYNVKYPNSSAVERISIEEVRNILVYENVIYNGDHDKIPPSLHAISCLLSCYKGHYVSCKLNSKDQVNPNLELAYIIEALPGMDLNGQLLFIALATLRRQQSNDYKLYSLICDDRNVIGYCCVGYKFDY